MRPPVSTVSRGLTNPGADDTPLSLIGDPCLLPLLGVVESVCNAKYSASGRGNIGPACLKCCRVAKHPSR